MDDGRLTDMPAEVITDFGYGLYQAQLGEHPDIGKTLAGFGGANVIELIQDHTAGTFRAVYTVRFSDAIVVLHAFQKKSKRGKETPKQDMELIRSRLKLAGELYKDWKPSPGNMRMSVLNDERHIITCLSNDFKISYYGIHHKLIFLKLCDTHVFGVMFDLVNGMQYVFNAESPIPRRFVLLHREFSSLGQGVGHVC